MVTCPVADGGEGTVEAAVASGFRSRRATVRGPLGHPVDAVFATKGSTAVVELAQASGLHLLPDPGPSPQTAAVATTYGTGQLLVAALDAGADEDRAGTRRQRDHRRRGGDVAGARGDDSATTTAGPRRRDGAPERHRLGRPRRPGPEDRGDRDRRRHRRRQPPVRSTRCRGRLRPPEGGDGRAGPRAGPGPAAMVARPLGGGRHDQPGAGGRRSSRRRGLRRPRCAAIQRPARRRRRPRHRGVRRTSSPMRAWSSRERVRSTSSPSAARRRSASSGPRMRRGCRRPSSPAAAPSTRACSPVRVSGRSTSCRTGSRTSGRASSRLPACSVRWGARWSSP